MDQGQENKAAEADADKTRTRRRRARRRAEAIVESAVAAPAPPSAPPPLAETPVPAGVAAASVPVAAVRAKQERRKTTSRKSQSVAAPAIAAPSVVAFEIPADAAADAQAKVAYPHPDRLSVKGTEAETDAEPPAEVDQFRDLLGQAVGLRLASVSREFDTADMKVTALREVSLEVGPGEFVAVIGPSGCGKTTLLSMLGGLDRPTTGTVYAAGLALDQLSEADLADYRLQRVSTIFQTFNLVPSMSVEENVSLPLVLAGMEPEERKARARHLLELVGLKHRAWERAGRLSGGEQQKVAVARALANRPGLILADEPTGSLDSESGERVLELLKDLNWRGATVVLVTHDPEVARHAHRAVRMIDGRAFELGSAGKNIRKQEPIMPPARMHWRDTLRLGLLSAGRRPLRTLLTTTGVAIGIAAMSLIVALAGGLGYALAAPGLAQARLDEVSVLPAPNAPASALDAPTLSALSSQPHVQAAWGDVALAGTFSVPLVPGAAPGPGATAGSTDRLVSLAPRARWTDAVPMVAGRMPSSDYVAEVVLSNRTASALVGADPRGAVGALGQTVVFTASAAKSISVQMTVVGVASDTAMPAGAAGGLAPNGFVTGTWTVVAKANGWKGGEFTSITLLADSDATVAAVRDRARALGFQAQTTGDQLRGFGELLSRLRVALLGLSVVALLLACLGIANTMYTAVLERTREIGILKAVGARSKDIRLLFVAEAAVIGLVGGVVGGVVAAFLSRLGNSAVDSIVPPASGASVEVFRPDLLVALAALVVAVGLSIVSGLLPAMRAAAQEPMKALHHE